MNADRPDADRERRTQHYEAFEQYLAYLWLLIGCGGIGNHLLMSSGNVERAMCMCQLLVGAGAKVGALLGPKNN